MRERVELIASIELGGIGGNIARIVAARLRRYSRKTTILSVAHRTIDHGMFGSNRLDFNLRAPILFVNAVVSLNAKRSDDFRAECRGGVILTRGNGLKVRWGDLER